MAGFSVEFLGTCACDFSPKLTGEFKDKFDPDARRASSVLVNGNILIDCGPHCCNSLDIIKKDYSEITDIFIIEKVFMFINIRILKCITHKG